MHINELLERVLNDLDAQHLIRYDRRNNFLSSTELGRITSHFYVACETMSIFCRNFGFSVEGDDVEEARNRKGEYKSDLDLLKITSHAKEFEQIKIRPEEMDELKRLMNTCWILDEKPEIEQKRKFAEDR